MKKMILVSLLAVSTSQLFGASDIFQRHLVELKNIARLIDDKQVVTQGEVAKQTHWSLSDVEGTASGSPNAQVRELAKKVAAKYKNLPKGVLPWES